MIVPPPVQYRRSVSSGQQQQQQQYHPCGCGPSAACHKSLPDLTDVVTGIGTTVTTTVDQIRRCHRSASSGSVVEDDCEDDLDDDDDIFETHCSGIPSPHG